MKTVAFIFARGGSKGLVNKNIRNFCGKPLISWAIQHAKAVDEISEVVVSTDSPEIAQIAIDYGARVPFIRPSELATDDSPEWLSWRHAVNFLRKEEGKDFDCFISVPATSPLRLPSDLRAALNLFSEKKAEVVVSMTESDRNPYFNIVEKDVEGYISISSKLPEPLFRRQDAPKTFDLTTVAYVTSPDNILKNSSIFSGRLKAIEIPRERALDIDNEYDFEIAEYLFTTKRMANNDK